jgi:hypothetical protein
MPEFNLNIDLKSLLFYVGCRGKAWNKVEEKRLGKTKVGVE